LSGNAVLSQLDLAWRMRNSVFMPHPVGPGRLRPQRTPVVSHPDGQYDHRPDRARRSRLTRRPSARVSELSTFSVDKRVQNTVGTQHPLRFLDKGQDLSNAHLTKGDRVCPDTDRLNRSPGVGQKSRRSKTGLSLLGSSLESGGHISGGDVGVAFGLISHERNETIPDDSDLRPRDARQHSARFVQQRRKC
jgi:hypothetical protein